MPGGSAAGVHPTGITPAGAALDHPPPAAGLTRRDALKALGVGAASVVVAGTAAGSYRVFDSGALHPGSGHAYDPWRQWRTGTGALGAVGAAVLAANPHNTQPWTFHVTADGIDVLADGDRAISSLDPYRREQHVGLGCAVENLVLGCRARGLAPDVTLMPSGPADARVAQVALTAGPVERGSLYDAIGRRHTNRGPYTDRPVAPDELRGLVDLRGLPGLQMTWIEDPAAAGALGDLLESAARAVVADERQSREGFAWFRADDDAVQQHRDGLTLDAQGLSPLVLAMGKLLPASSRSAGDAFWLTQTRTVHTRTAAAYGVITADDPDDRTTQLLAGRLLQRVHLAATVRGIALQHMNQITERMDAERVGGVAPAFATRFAQLLPDGARPIVTFRVGYPERAARPSPRRPVRAVLR